MNQCEHDWENCYCERCGKYQGQQCNHCGDWYDGGDHMAAQEEIWCSCDPFDDNDQPIE